MHAIIEIKNNEKTLITTSIPNNNFLDYIKKRICIDNYSLVENISSGELRVNEVFKAGKYLIKNDNYITYIEKTIVQDRGLFYSTMTPKIDILCEWEKITNNITTVPKDYTFYSDTITISYKDSLSSPKSIRHNDFWNDSTSSSIPSIDSEDRCESSYISEDISSEISESYSGEDITITKFNLNQLPQSFKIYIIGEIDSTQILQDIISFEDKSFIENSLVICNSDSKKYSDIGLKTAVGYNQSIVMKHLKNDTEGCLILDNCLNSECDWIYNLTMADVLKYQTKKSIILITYKPIPFTKEIIKQFDFLYLLKYLSCDNIRQIYDHIKNIFQTYSVFKDYYFSLTQNSPAMVLDNKTKSTFMIDKVFKYENETQIDSDTESLEISSCDDKKIQPFDLGKINQYGSINIIGKRGVGKSSMAAKILEKYDDEFIANSLIINPKEKMIPFYTLKFPTAKILFDFDKKEIGKYLSRTPGAIIFDECQYCHIDSHIFSELIYNNKYYKKLFITIYQNPLALNRNLRENLNYVFLLGEYALMTKKNLYSCYGGTFPTFDDFNQYMDSAAKEKCAIVIDKVNNQIAKYF
jgi:hypothetical protein